LSEFAACGSGTGKGIGSGFSGFTGIATATYPSSGVAMYSPTDNRLDKEKRVESGREEEAGREKKKKREREKKRRKRSTFESRGLLHGTALRMFQSCFALFRLFQMSRFLFINFRKEGDKRRTKAICYV
jgi:hypothetical protein